MRKAKIVCTIGPATESPELLDQLIESGMNVARLNFSHGSHESHGRAIKAIRAAAARRHVAVAIIQDLQGPRIRVGQVPAGGIELAPGDRVRLLAGEGEARTRGADHEIPVTYPHLALDVRPGARILIDDGLVELTVTRIGPGVVDCAVVTGGRVTAHKGINLPGTRITAPTVTDKDLDDLQFGLTQGVDYVALSFVRAPEDVAAAKKIIAESGADVPVIAKVERPEAIACLESLLDQADGVMIARAALNKPWLFKQVQAALAGEPIPPDPTLEEERELLMHHYHLVCARFGAEKGTILMGKFACCYAQGRPGAREFRSHVSHVRTPEEFQYAVETYFPR